MNPMGPSIHRWLLFAAALVAPHLHAAPPNLLSNPGFESGLTGWSAHTGGTAQAVTTLPHSGAQAARSTNRTSTGHGLRQAVLGVAVPGTSYVASAWVRTSSTTPVAVSMGVQQTDGFGTRNNAVLSAQVADGWTRISGVFEFDVNGTITTLNLFINGAPAAVDVFVDDASFSAVDTSAIENLLTNSGFEGGTAGWLPRGPTTLAAAPPHSGSGSVSVTGRTAAFNGMEQSVFGKTEDGRLYYGAGWVTTDSPTAEPVKLTLQVIDSSGTRFFAIAAGTAASSTWTWLSGTVTMPVTSGLTNVKFLVEGPQGGVSMRVDNCYFAPVTGLRRAVTAYPGLRLGMVSGLATWAEDPRFRSTVSGHFHLSSPENATKFSPTEPEDGIWRFAEANSIVELGLARGGSSRGHTFVWHNGVPTWVTDGAFTPAQLQTILWDQIDTKGAAFRHRLPWWDVANEVIVDGASGALRSTLWYNTPGIGYASGGYQYLRESFARARAVDPDTALFYNDYNIESVNPKSDAVYTMLSNFVGGGVPVQGIGFQSHFANAPPTLSSVRTNFQRFQDLGLDIHITEMDVRLPVNANGFATPANLAMQGDSYFDYLGAALGYSRLKIFQVWGLHDGASYVPIARPGFGQALPFDFDLDRKPAYWGIWNALAGQCEKLTVSSLSSGDTQSVLTNTLLSANSARQFEADAVNDLITLRAQVPFRGQWNVKLGVLRQQTGGIMRLSISPPGSTTFTNVGVVQDTYSATAAAGVLDLGTVDFSAPGEWRFRFTVTGKNAAASDFNLALDYIRLSPVACEPSFTMPVAAQSIASNTSLVPKLFMAEDDTAEGSLVVTATSSNAVLVPNGKVVIDGSSPYFTVAATPLADRLGTATITLSASDGTTTTTSTFSLAVTGSPIETWRMEKFGTTSNSGASANTADDDRDGTDNLLEYATAMNPNASDVVPLSLTRGAASLDFIYRRNKAAADVTYVTEWSDTLLDDWSVTGVSAPVELSDDGVVQQIKVTVPATGAKRFVRLKVALP